MTMQNLVIIIGDWTSLFHENQVLNQYWLNQLKADGTITCNYNKTQDIEIQEIKKYDSCHSTQWIMS